MSSVPAVNDSSAGTTYSYHIISDVVIIMSRHV